MLSARILYVFFAAILCGLSLKASMRDAEFKKLNASLEQVVKTLDGQSLSNEQMMTLSGHLMKLGMAVEKAYKNKKIAPSIQEETTTWVRLTNNQSKKGNFYSTPPKAMKPNFNYAVYSHTLLDKSAIKNNLRPFQVFDAELAKNKIQSENKNCRTKTKENKLLLAIEIYFRKLIEADNELLKKVKYIGLRKSDKRADGHVRELCNESRCMQSTKAIVESNLMDIGVDIGMHTAISNLEEDELKLFEALLGHLFRVQIFGASAIIADTAAFERLGEYLAWNTRTIELKKMGLYQVVEEQAARQLIQSLPSKLWPDDSSFSEEDD